MDIIYSRYNKRNFSYNKIKLIIAVLIIIIISYSTAIMIIKAINPTLERQSKIIARSLAEGLTNSITKEEMQNYKYEDLCSIQKDENGNISMLNLNIINVNKLTSTITSRLQKEINNNNNSIIKISLGSVTGNKLLMGRGPKINVKIETIGNIQTSIRSEVKEAGINQSLHKIYLNIECNMAIISAYKDTDEKITTEVLIAEAVIVGKIPETYYNLNGIGVDDTMNMMN